MTTHETASPVFPPEEDFSVATEVIRIVEGPDAQGELILSEDFLSLPEEEQEEYARDFLLLARDQLTTEAAKVPVEATVERSTSSEHAHCFLMLHLVLNEEGDFDLVTIFGGLCHPEASLQAALWHAAKVVRAMEDELL